MLTLTRKKGEEIVIGEDIVITVREIGSDSVKISVSAPRDVPVFRRELKMAVEENQEAAKTGADAAGLATLLAKTGNSADRRERGRKQKDKAERRREYEI